MPCVSSALERAVPITSRRACFIAVSPTHQYMKAIRMTKIAKFIKDLRTKKNISQDDIARELSFSSSSPISQWENSRTEPTKNNFLRFVRCVYEVFDNDPEWSSKVADASKFFDSHRRPATKGPQKYYDFLCHNRKALENYISYSGFYGASTLGCALKPGIPLVAKREWVPSKLLPVHEIQLELRSRSPEDKPSFPTFTDQYPRFSEFKSAQGERLSDDRIYRLIDVQAVGDVLTFVCDDTHYDWVLDHQELFAYETAKRYVDTDRQPPNLDGSSLPIRGPASNAFNFPTRECAWSTNTITVITNHPKHPDHFYIHNRNSPALAEGKNTVSIAPAGTFQPFGVQEWEEDFSLEKNIIREFLEELLDRSEYQKMVFSNEYIEGSDEANAVWHAYRDGLIKIHFLGFGLDPLTLKGGFLSAMVIDWEKCQHIFQNDFTFNWEGSFERKEFSKAALQEVATLPNVLPFGAACCLRAIKHYDDLLSL